MSRTFSLALVFLFVFGLVSSCENTSCGCDPAPSYSASALLYTWRLDEVAVGGQSSSKGNDIKDRYKRQFKSDGTYTQTQLDDNSTTTGTWKLTGQNNMLLEITDHKGATATYNLGTVDNTTLVYSFINKDQLLEQHIFSRQ
ncbi:lipocalin family protein [Hymenobacter sp. BT18]|uniref:lipocalin family protein n=1 Tax=Hymenobacter sp. BT18 TaxID=2835648 RepID=UPI00143EC27B|nr:lipocalin family protein [Hymenobacter sp. BT18]QIX62679.1 lipocalin family protein [Hymenobacter sp. BT18]